MNVGEYRRCDGSGRERSDVASYNSNKYSMKFVKTR